MTALELAKFIDEDADMGADEYFKAADMLRRQHCELLLAHEAIKQLREALHNTKQSLIGNTTCVYSPYADEVIAAAEQALKDTEGL